MCAAAARRWCLGGGYADVIIIGTHLRHNAPVGVLELARRGHFDGVNNAHIIVAGDVVLLVFLSDQTRNRRHFSTGWYVQNTCYANVYHERGIFVKFFELLVEKNLHFLFKCIVSPKAIRINCSQVALRMM